MHRVTIGRTREVRGPDALERGCVGLIILVAMAFAVWIGVHQVHIAEVTEAISLAKGIETNAIVYRSVHGTWPSAGDKGIDANDYTGSYVKRTRLLHNGVISMQLAPGAEALKAHGTVVSAVTGTLAFRPQLLGAPGSETVTMLCGYAPSVGQSAPADAANKTTLDRRDLPPTCR